MEYLVLFPLGIMLGMAHAFEADHLAAVSTMHAREDGVKNMIRRGAIWGAGHSTSLLVVCASVFALGLTISGALEAALEGLVGIMIVMLGVVRIMVMRRDNVHAHSHEHDGVRHIHLHSHLGEKVAHDQSAHKHPKQYFSAGKRFFSVGLMHGLAGSAGLLVLMAATAENIGEVLAYIVVFGAGSIIGMAALSAVISLPLRLVHKLGGWAPNIMAVSISVAAILVGGTLAIESFNEILGHGV